MTQTFSDTLRAWSNLLLAPMIWLLSSIGFIIPNLRTASDFSDLSDNLLVPLGPAFSIWFPIFIGCIAYGIVQFRRQNRTRPFFRRTGWWTASGFAFISLWSIIVAFAPTAFVQWGTALVFLPALIVLCIATVRFSRDNSQRGWTKWLCLVPISLITGWCSLAVILNWTPIAYDLFAGGQANLLSSLLMLSLALGVIAFMLRQTRGSLAYLFPGVWGSFWLAARHLGSDDGVAMIAYVALGGVLILVVSALLLRRKASKA
jgi:hypothetical protein